MNPESKARFKRQLEDMVAVLQVSLKPSDQTAPVALDTSIGRLSRMDAIQSQQMALALKQRQQQQLARVERALQAITDDTYGQCRRCQKAIAFERLEAQPDAVLCVNCAEQARR